MTTESRTFAEKLLAALTPEEMAALISYLPEVLGPEDFRQLLARVSSDQRQVIEQVFAPDGSQAPPVSLEKQRAQWGIYHKAWNQLIAKAQNENSAYWIQDQHWEPPYFDTSTFLEDLLEVLQRMAPLRETAIAHGFKGLPDFPAELGEIYEAIVTGTPEWTRFEEGLDFNADFTAEVMAWSWAWARFRHLSPAAFLEAFYEKDLAFRDRYIELDHQGFVNFFEQLAPELRQQLLACLEAQREAWADELEDLRSPWHQLHMSLLKLQAPETFLETRAGLIAQDWTQGAEVIRLWLERGDPAKAWELVQASFEALIEQVPLGPDWSTDTNLLAVSLGLHGGAGADAVELLELAQDIASRMKLNDLRPVLEIQLQAFEQDAGWEPMLNLLRTRPLTETSRDHLFEDWKSLTAGQTLRHSPKGEWWLHWLLDAAREPEDPASRKRFLTRMSDWLTRSPGASLAEHKPLLLLTSDFLAISGQQDHFATLARQVKRHLSLSHREVAQQDRRRYLKAMLNEAAQSMLLQFWREHARLWVPDPGKVSNGDYDDHAAWLKLMQELACPDFAPLLADWKQQHRLRRNLWKALAQVGIN